MSSFPECTFLRRTLAVDSISFICNSGSFVLKFFSGMLVVAEAGGFHPLSTRLALDSASIMQLRIFREASRLDPTVGERPYITPPAKGTLSNTFRSSDRRQGRAGALLRPLGAKRRAPHAHAQKRVQHPLRAPPPSRSSESWRPSKQTASSACAITSWRWLRAGGGGGANGGRSADRASGGAGVARV